MGDLCLRLQLHKSPAEVVQGVVPQDQVLSRVLAQSLLQGGLLSVIVKPRGHGRGRMVNCACTCTLSVPPLPLPRFPFAHSQFSSLHPHSHLGILQSGGMSCIFTRPIPPVPLPPFVAARLTWASCSPGARAASAHAQPLPFPSPPSLQRVSPGHLAVRGHVLHLH